MNTRVRFDGWVFKNETSERVLQTGLSQVSFHTVRIGKWPQGAYVGWSNIHPQALEVLATLESVYGSLGLKRCGLRYLNRIAIPSDSSLSEWFALTPVPPSNVEELYAFTIDQAWGRIKEAEHLSAHVRLTKIAIEDEMLAKGNQGVLLDIEIFNLLVAKAPQFASLPAWFDQAHTVENRLFESYITEALRDSFERI